MTIDPPAAQRLQDAKAASVAMLAVVPYQHLVSGLATAASAGRVAYGTDNGLILSGLEHILGGQTCPVLIYASENPIAGSPKVTWRALYSRQQGSVSGMHPDHESLRPKTTDSDGSWLTFWEVTDLERLDEAYQLPMSNMRGLNKKSNLPSSFVPKGPLLIHNPY